MYYGWIGISKDVDPIKEQHFLESIGVKLGPLLNGDTFEPCEVPPEALDRLDRHWGRFIWHLEEGQKPAPFTPPEPL